MRHARDMDDGLLLGMGVLADSQRQIIRLYVTSITESYLRTYYSTLATFGAWEMTMKTITNHTSERSLGAYLVDLFKVDADQFQMSAQKPRSGRECDFLNRPYELSDLMRQATAAGVWPH